MSDHDPTAADVLAAGLADEQDPDEDYEWWCTPRDHAADILAALSAAGLSVVRTGEVPAWMADANCVDCGCSWGWSGVGNEGEMYVLRPKENQ